MFSACGDGSLAKFKKRNPNKWILANSFFKLTDNTKLFAIHPM